jgi:hypothetical protein
MSRRTPLVLAFGLAALLGGCFRDHPAATEVDQKACGLCHPQVDGEPSDGIHAAAEPTSCGNCHVSDPPSWQFVHPQAPFRARSHHSITPDNCSLCHDPNRGDDYMQNLDCLNACHQDHHHRDPNRPGRCFDCHPSGQAGD